jgi:hypothetical protein
MQHVSVMRELNPAVGKSGRRHLIKTFEPPPVSPYRHAPHQEHGGTAKARVIQINGYIPLDRRVNKRPLWYASYSSDVRDSQKLGLCPLPPIDRITQSGKTTGSDSRRVINDKLIDGVSTQ